MSRNVGNPRVRDFISDRFAAVVGTLIMTMVTAILIGIAAGMFLSGQ